MTFGEGAHEVDLVGDRSEVFVAHYQPDGTLDWAKSAGGADYDEGYGVSTCANGSCVVTGRFLFTARFGEGARTLHLSSDYGDDLFVARYDADGSLAWAVSGGGPGSKIVISVATFADDSCVLTGCFTEEATFGEGAAATSLHSRGTVDILVLRLNADGGF